MKNAKHQLWRHYRDTPFEVMSVILFSALTFGSAGAALTHGAAKDRKASHIQTVLTRHAPATPADKPTGNRHV